jgi:simple sugar transport system ATP-binding protein
VLDVAHVSKRYGPVIACRDVSLEVAGGEVLGLLGENGAGKTTLMKVAGGIVAPEAGRVAIDGRDLRLGDPIAAGEAGIGIVHQHFSLVGALTVWENVSLGERGRVDSAASIQQVGDLGARYGLSVNPNARVDTLSPSDRQRVEIIKCLRRRPRVIILDEPTSVLSQVESASLFTVLRDLVAAEGLAVVLVSHRLDEVLRATDRITVMRAGQIVFTGTTTTTTVDQLAREMLGRDVQLSREAAALGATGDRQTPFPAVDSTTPATPSSIDGARKALELRNVVVDAPDGRRLLDALSLHVDRGEILGVAGVEGNGQGPLLDLLSGLSDWRHGTVRLDGQDLRPGSQAYLSRIGVIPADPHDSGCVLGMSVMENLVLGQLGLVTRRGVLSPRQMAAHAHQLVHRFGITAASLNAPLWSLSGGNQQRVILARELAKEPVVLVAAQPTRGLDVGAIEDLWQRIRQVAAAGTAVLLISTELDEVLALSDRVAVIQRGRVVGEMNRSELDPQRLGLMIGGRVA